MVTLISLFLQLIIIFVTKPFSLFKRFCIFGVKSICIVIQTWIELLRAAICLHVHIVWSLVVWSIAIVSLPSRILNALQRERLLEMHLLDMQAELETLVWDKKELEEQLSMAIKERNVMEILLAELEEEHELAIVKIELLEGELHDLKDQNHHLEKVKRKAFWSPIRQVDTGQKTSNTDKYISLHQIPSPTSSFKGGGTALDHPMHKDAGEDATKSKFETQNLMRTGSSPSGPIDPFMPCTTNSDVTEVLEQRREVALSQSLFSAILSLVVGYIVLEAEDPCMPLVVALFFVVAMSLKSVVQFFFTIKNKPASDAVALLSFNWFILGALTYPTLPRVARMFTPYSLSFSKWTVRWLGFYS